VTAVRSFCSSMIVSGGVVNPPAKRLSQQGDNVRFVQSRSVR
jgi:hypothetical protein